jgi:hypothetical protein
MKANAYTPISIVIWLADTNYRVDLENELVRSLAVTDQLNALLAADQVPYQYVHVIRRCPFIDLFVQLKLAMDQEAAFVGYEEGPILFRPTYRYNLGSDVYDTSEKSRIPAWTGAFTCDISMSNIIDSAADRILYRGNDLDINAYSRAELYGSDHRPGKLQLLHEALDHVI